MISTETVTYSSISAKGLKMDIYRAEQASQGNEPSPVVIHIPNGNFLGAERRNDAIHQHACRYFAGKGYLSVSIDYRQGLRGAEFLPHTILEAIHMGMDDLTAATRYIISHAKELNANTEKISLLGTGAGACIALTAEYERANHRLTALPDGFRYACVVAHSGAMATGEPQFSWTELPCPIMLVQGKPAGDIPSGRFFVPGLLWVGGADLHAELNRAGAKSLYYDVSGFEHLAMKGQQMDSERITEYLDLFVMRDIEMMTK